MIDSLRLSRVCSILDQILNSEFFFLDDGFPHDVTLYNDELALMTADGKGNWFTVSWLFAECYMFVVDFFSAPFRALTESLKLGTEEFEHYSPSLVISNLSILSQFKKWMLFDLLRIQL